MMKPDHVATQLIGDTAGELKDPASARIRRPAEKHSNAKSKPRDRIVRKTLAARSAPHPGLRFFLGPAQCGRRRAFYQLT
jgi:hypothetical protein